MSRMRSKKSVRWARVRIPSLVVKKMCVCVCCSPRAAWAPVPLSPLAPGYWRRCHSSAPHHPETEELLSLSRGDEHVSKIWLYRQRPFVTFLSNIWPWQRWWGCVCVYIQGFCRFQQVEFKIFYDIVSLWMHLKNYELFILNVIYGMCRFLQLIFEFRCNSNAFIPSLAYIYIFQYIGYLYKYAVLIIHPWCVCVHVHFLTLLTPFHLLDLVHSALEDVALVRLDTETGNVTHVGWQQLSQLLDVAALQLPSPLLQTAGKKQNKTDV